MRITSSILPMVVWFASLGAAHARDSVDPGASASDPHLRVWCKDGSIFRGEVIELVPKSYVVLQLSGGRTIKIEWSKIAKTQAADDSEVGRSAPPLPAPVQAEPKAPPQPIAQPRQPVVQPAEPAPVVTVRSEEIRTSTAQTPSVSGLAMVTVRTSGMRSGALIEYRGKTMEIDGPTWPIPLGEQTVEEWKPLCAVPCVAKIDPDLPIRLRGPNIQPTGRMWVPSRGERYEMEISPGNTSVRKAAWITFGVGMGLLVTGSMMLGLGKYDAGPGPLPLAITVPGGVGASLGLAGLITSLPLFGKSVTTVEFFRE